VVTTKWNSSLLVKPLVKARKLARSLSPEEFCLLHAADFRYRLENEVLPALWRGQTVNRGPLPVHRTGPRRGARLDFEWLLDVYDPPFWPDIVFYFAVSPKPPANASRPTARRTSTRPARIHRHRRPFRSYTHFIGRVIQEYEALAHIFQFVTVDAEQPIFDQHREIRGLYEHGRRRPWDQRNQKALIDWMSPSPGGDRSMTAQDTAAHPQGG